jgi:sensor c-di-GMP phosphodiesterase-like protein
MNKQDDILIQELDKIIERKLIRTLFQPIVDLRTGNVLGYEALSRGPKGSPLETAPKLFTAATEYDKLL